MQYTWGSASTSARSPSHTCIHRRFKLERFITMKTLRDLGRERVCVSDEALFSNRGALNLCSVCTRLQKSATDQRMEYVYTWNTYTYTCTWNTFRRNRIRIHSLPMCQLVYTLQECDSRYGAAVHAGRLTRVRYSAAVHAGRLTRVRYGAAVQEVHLRCRAVYLIYTY